MINITASSHLGIHDVNDACNLIRAATENDDVQINFGVVLDQKMDDNVKITVIATGFQRDTLPEIDRRGLRNAARHRLHRRACGRGRPPPARRSAVASAVVLDPAFQAALEAALGHDQLIREPLPRAVLQRDLWAVFDWLANPHAVYGYRSDDVTPEQRALQVRLAKIIRPACVCNTLVMVTLRV